MDQADLSELIQSAGAMRSTPAHTHRTTSEDMEIILHKPYPVLDHGFIRVVDYMGDESTIVSAARVSYGKGTKSVREDRGLIRYLMRHRHTSPLEMCELMIHAKMPIFVARQWVRHRTAALNEYSARYSVLDNEFYIPDPSRLGRQSTTNKQGTGDELTPEEQQTVLDLLRVDATSAYSSYNTFLNDYDLSRELARIGLPVSAYTQWYWKIDLKNLLHFLALRADTHAQYEIRVYADVLCDIVSKWLPMVWEAFEDYHPLRGGHSLSGPEVDALRHLLTIKAAELDHTQVRAELLPHLKGRASNREIREFFQFLGIARD